MSCFNEAIDRRIDEQEAALRRILEPLNAVRWAAFEARAEERGIQLRAAVELR